MSIRMPAGLREWLRDKARRDGTTAHAVALRALSEMRERDHAGPPAAGGSGSPDAIDRT